MKLWEHLDSAERINAVLTAVIAFLTLVNVLTTVVYVCTFIVSNRGATSQTDKIIRASESQARSAEKMAETASSQAKQMIQLAEGTQAAFIFWTFDNTLTEPPQFKIYFTNSGKVAAQEFTANVTITRERLKEHTLKELTPIGKPVLWRIPPMPVRVAENEPSKQVSIGFDSDAVKRFDETIKAEAVGSYDDGFGRRVPINFCKYYIVLARSIGFEDCLNADALIQQAINAKKAAESDAEKKK
jgi:hypothetical protein